MIAIVDYGAGNISSVKKALEHLGAEAQVTADPQVIAVLQLAHGCRCVVHEGAVGALEIDGIIAVGPRQNAGVTA